VSRRPGPQAPAGDTRVAAPPSAIARRRAAAREEGSAAYVERRREIIAAAFADTLLLGLEVPEPERPSGSTWPSRSTD
jgi:hypothetical protein